MRVNISFSVELEEIPEKTLEFLGELEEILKTTALPSIIESQEKLKEENIKKASDAINNALEATQKITIRLGECANLLAGYQKLLHEPPENPHIATPAEGQYGMPVFPEQGDFKEMMNSNSDYVEQLAKMNAQLEGVSAELKKIEPEEFNFSLDEERNND